MVLRVLLSFFVLCGLGAVAFGGEALSVGTVLADPRAYHMQEVTLRGKVHDVREMAPFRKGVWVCWFARRPLFISPGSETYFQKITGGIVYPPPFDRRQWVEQGRLGPLPGFIRPSLPSASSSSTIRAADPTCPP